MRTILFFFMPMLLCAQYSQERLFTGLEGEVLLDQVVSEYKANILFFDYGTTRDTMFREVYAVDDSLECVYSGHKLYMDPTKDPTTTVFMNGADNGINTEHTYPRSKGAGFGNAKSDMHHLFPTRAQVNEERSNFSFGDIDDDAATKWFWKDQTLLERPDVELDKYSEWKWQVFEPRESFKGNVARAVMYFYTMYKSQADSEDPDFFWDMLPDLCEWHFADPVDSVEYERTWLISQWQQYPNPFILDCTLASRSYCADIMDDACELAVPVAEVESSSLKITYDVVNDRLNLEIKEDAVLHIYSMNGSLMKEESLSMSDDLSMNMIDLSPGTYVAHLISANKLETLKFVKL